MPRKNAEERIARRTLNASKCFSNRRELAFERARPTNVLPRSGENRTMRATRLNGPRRTTRERRATWKALSGRIPSEDRVNPFEEREREREQKEKRNAWLITQDQYTRLRRGRRGWRERTDEEVEEIPRSWRNRKDFNDLHLPP